jgi:two-component system chemotaxis response regulator CheY
MRALVVDDSRSVRIILSKALREAGFDVSEAEDGRQALSVLYQGGNFDLMLLDWNMPVMNGYEVVCAIRANPLLANLRIMMVTTETCINKVRDALDAGANEYLMKPFTKELLLDKMAIMGFVEN